MVTAPLLNKLGAFLTDPLLHSILTGDRSSFDLRRIMGGEILVVNLAKGKLGGRPAALLGALLVSHLSLAAMERADRPQEERRDFYLPRRVPHFRHDYARHYALRVAEVPLEPHFGPQVSLAA